MSSKLGPSPSGAHRNAALLVWGTARLAFAGSRVSSRTLAASSSLTISAIWKRLASGPRTTTRLCRRHRQSGSSGSSASNTGRPPSSEMLASRCLSEPTGLPPASSTRTWITGNGNGACRPRIQSPSAHSTNHRRFVYRPRLRWLPSPSASEPDGSVAVNVTMYSSSLIVQALGIRR